MASELACWNCGTSLESVPRPISRHEHCPKCFEALHCCRLCRHYDTGVTGHCDDERADPPVQKENANFCEFYRPRFGAFVASRAEQADEARARLEALFGTSDADAEPDGSGSTGEPGASAEDAPRAKLEALFGGADDDEKGPERP